MLIGALLALALALWPAAASAEPISASLATALVAAFSVSAATAKILASAIILAVTVGASLLLQSLAPKPKIKQTGLQTEFTTTGENEPQSFILGRYATNGHFVAPPMSHGNDNSFLTYVIEVSNVPGVTLERVIIGDDYSAILTDDPFAGVSNPHPEYGNPLEGQRWTPPHGTYDYAWVKFYDGTQTAADPMLLDKYGSHPDRPWTVNHIGKDTAYAIVTFLYSRTIYSGMPKARFEVGGIPLYDPRKDTTAGGNGAHRWNDPATWEASSNPVVMIYNIMRGITLPDGNIYGGGVLADGLPFANWVAAMNVCDTSIGGRAQFQAGFEVKVDMPPADVIDELLKTCLGQISEFGGVFRIRCGAPATPVLSITDDDVLISEARNYRPFPGEDSTYNAITAQYVEPSALWETREAEPIYNPTWEGEDGGRRLPISMTFPAVENNSQVQQLITAYIADHRRFRRHSMVLPPFAAILEPLDTIAWTSARNGYSAKVFEVVELVDNPFSLNQQIEVRERDPLDYSWDAVQDLPAPTGHVGLTLPAAQAVDSWAVTAIVVQDSNLVSRRPALLLEWTGDAALDADLVRWEVRLQATGDLVASGTADATAGAVTITQGILPAETYEARGRYIIDRPSAWSAWLAATTADIRLSEGDLDAIVQAQLSSVAERAAEAVARHDATLAEAENRIEALRALTLPEQRDLADRLDDLAGIVTYGLQRLQDTTGNLAEAGLLVDEATGRAYISGVLQNEARLSEVQLDLDAANSQIALRATMAEVNAAISNAILDPSQIPIIDDLEYRLGVAEITLDANSAAIALKASQVTVNGIDARLSTAEIDIDANAAAIALKASQTEVDDIESRLTDAEIEIGAIDGASIRQAVIDTRKNADDIDAASFSSLQEMWEAWKSREDLRESIAFAQTEILAVVHDGLDAEAAARLDLGVQVEGNTASIIGEQVARASADSALASDITALQASLTTTSGEVAANASAVSALDVRVTSAEGSIASQASDITDLEVSVAAALVDIDGNTTAINGNASAITVLDGRVTAAEGDISAQASDITDLQADLTALDGSVTGNANAINSLDARVTVNEGDITATASDLTKLTVRLTDASNLVPNGPMVTADYWTFLSGWTLETPAASDLGQRSVGIAKYTYSGGAGLSLSMRSDQFGVAAGTSYTVSGQVARIGAAGQFAARLQIQWFDSSGTPISALLVWNVSVTATTFQRYASTMVAPAGAATARLLVFCDLSGSSASGYVAGFEVIRMGDAILDAQADITTLQSVKVDAAGAVAAVDAQVSAQYGSLSAMAVATQFAEQTSNYVAAGFILRAGAGGASGTLEIVAGNDANGPASTIRLAADNVRIVGEAQIDDAVITAAKIQDAAITSAKIGDAAITNAKIGDLEVDTIKIAEGAVTVPVSATGANFLTVGGIVVLPDFTLAEPAPLFVFFNGHADGIAQNAGATIIDYYIDDVLQGSRSVNNLNIGDASYHTFAWYIPTLSAGTYTHYLKERRFGAEFTDWTFFSIGTMR